METKIQLEIVALSHSLTQTHNYAVILGEVNGARRLPVVIGNAEAQSIAVGLEKIVPARPITHDLVKNIFDVYQIKIQEIIISNLVDGIFYATLVCEKDGKIEEIDSRTSDAIALAVRFSCPIFIYEFILDQAGIVMTDTIKEEIDKDLEEEEEHVESGAEEDFSKMNTEKLEELLNRFLEQEEYEKAIRVRDEINKRKSKES